MHDDLLAQLPAEVYQALDMPSGMSYKARVMLQDSCKRGDMANLLDRTTAAAFSHQSDQTLLSLADGAHFDPTKRGLALDFVGKPVSTLIIGNNFCVKTPLAEKHCTCAIFRQYPTRGPWPPVLRMSAALLARTLRGSCPGWTATGNRVPASWNGDDIAPACQADWKLFALSLPRARTASGPDALF